MYVLKIKYDYRVVCQQWTRVGSTSGTLMRSITSDFDNQFYYVISFPVGTILKGIPILYFLHCIEWEHPLNEVLWSLFFWGEGVLGETFCLF